MDKSVNKNKKISIIAFALAIALIAGITAKFLIDYTGNKKDNTADEKVTSFSIIGNADSEVSSQYYTQVNPNEYESQTGGEITTNKNEIVTDKNGNTVTTPTNTQPNKPNNQQQSTPTTQIQITPNTPITDPSVFTQASNFGFAYDSASGLFYSTSDPWQRQFGYNEYYDKLGGYIALYFDTVRVKFNYGGYDWLVQFWKGQYGFLLLGAEAGVYYKDENDPTAQYICLDNNMRLKIGYTCYYKGNVLFERAYQNTWWLTGFVPGRLDKFADRSDLKMKIRITLKDEEMKNAFVEALQKSGVGFTQGNATTSDTFYTSGNDVYLMWQTDRSKTS